MKKIISIMTTALLAICAFSVNINASTINEQKKQDDQKIIELLPNGDVIEETLVLENTLLRSSTKKGSRIVEYKKDGKVLWKATLSATFTYTGSSAKCTASSISATSYVSTWKITSKSASKSGNVATGNVTAKQYYVSTPIQTVNRTLKITCSASGVLLSLIHI